MCLVLPSPRFCGPLCFCLPRCTPQAERLTVLHPHGSLLSGCRQLAPTLYEGGRLLDAAMLVRCGKAKAEDFVFFRGRELPMSPRWQSPFLPCFG